MTIHERHIGHLQNNTKPMQEWNPPVEIGQTVQSCIMCGAMLVNGHCIRCYMRLSADPVGKITRLEKQLEAFTPKQNQTKGTKMKTLKELIINTKCRKGKARAIDKHGAFWLACPEIEIRVWGGDGVGQSMPNHKNYLELRHYRNGTVVACVTFQSWHQNAGTTECVRTADQILSCTDIESVIVALKNLPHELLSPAAEGYFPDAYSDSKYARLSSALIGLGLSEAQAAPDEEASNQQQN